MKRFIHWLYGLWLNRKRRLRYEELQELKKTLDHTFSVMDEYVEPFRGEFFKPSTKEKKSKR